MPKTISIGFQGPPVFDLQAKLNCYPLSTFPRLAIDGQFGPKTFARVKEFQRDFSLSVDGIVGPLTWGELEEGLETPAAVTPRCANCDPANAMHVSRVRQAFMPALLQPRQAFDARAKTAGRSFSARGVSPRTATRSSVAPDTVATVTLLGIGITAAPLSPMQRTVATARFGSSLDLDCIFITDQTGAGNRPFTLTIPLTPGMPRFGALSMVILLNMGTLTPDGNTFVHEMAHAWQAQHHILPVQYIENSAKSQALALARNTPIGIFDSGVRNHKNFPLLFPFSPYAYEPGKPFGEYGAEQIASQVEDNETAIVTHVKAGIPGKHDSLNADSLASAQVDDRRRPGVK